MIKGIEVGDITSPKNQRDIVIGMNTTLDEVNGIGIPFADDLRPKLADPIKLGHVLSFEFDETRRLHMLVCHDIGRGGWHEADKYVRFGLDYLNHVEGGRGEFSIVQIGTGEIGLRDGADHVAIRTAMAMSFLPVVLFVRGEAEEDAVDHQALPLRMRPYAVWHPEHGPQKIPLVA